MGPLGERTAYPSTYTPSLLHSIKREDARRDAQVSEVDELRGEDLWTAYEFSWLDTQGKPMVAGLRMGIPCHSPAIIESKSLKLYLGSFALTKFENQSEVLRTLDQDLTLAFRSPLVIEILELNQLELPVQQLAGTCLDTLDVFITAYERDAGLLKPSGEDRVVREAVYSNVFRSLCPVTAQPDWASIAIEYTGAPIDHASILKYLVSYRSHQAFHETTVELIYQDVLRVCEPSELSVYGRFQRRGGIDINPFRGSHAERAPLCRLPRQ